MNVPPSGHLLLYIVVVNKILTLQQTSWKHRQPMSFAMSYMHSPWEAVFAKPFLGECLLFSIANCNTLCYAGASNEVLLALNEIKSLLQVHSALQLDRFMYTEGKVTRKTDLGAQLFSRSVKSDYGALEGTSKCWCLLTNAVLPSSTVIGSHLFKLEWSEYVHLLGFDNINDVKNGLPLWKPIQWAFDTSRLCFTFDKNSDKFIAKITDPSILMKKLVDIGRDKMGTDWRSPPSLVQNLTFQDIDNRALEFDPKRPMRPYKRVLNFHARQARTYAIRHGWQPASWDFEDYLTEGMELSEKLKIWYNSMR